MDCRYFFFNRSLLKYQQCLQKIIATNFTNSDSDSLYNQMMPPPLFPASSYHGLQKCLMLISHLIKLVNAATALVSKHQCPGLQGMVSRTPLLGQGDLVLTGNWDTIHVYKMHKYLKLCILKQISMYSTEHIDFKSLYMCNWHTKYFQMNANIVKVVTRVKGVKIADSFITLSISNGWNQSVDN